MIGGPVKGESLRVDAGVLVDNTMGIEAAPACSDPLPGIPLKLIVANEFAERFCFYGTRSLLVLYLKSLGFSDANAVTAYSLYLAGCYLSPLLGGYISDGEARSCYSLSSLASCNTISPLPSAVYLGRFRTIVTFNVSYILGVTIWGGTAFINSTPGCLIGLALMALGTGGIKPNISPLGADQLIGASERQLIAYFFWSVQYYHSMKACKHPCALFAKSSIAFCFQVLLRH